MKSITLLKVLFIIPFFLFTACSKDSPEPEEPYTDNGYIRGNFGSEYLNYTTPLQFTNGGDSSSHYYDPNINGGTLTLMRQGQSSDSRHCTIQIWGIDLDNIPIPSDFNQNPKLPVKNGYTLYGGLGLWDSATPSSITTNGPDDSYNYSAVTVDNFSMRLISKKNDILKGTFEGQIRTASGLVKSVSKGEFRIKIVRKG